MRDKLTLPKDTNLAEKVIESQNKEMEIGVLGKFFGSSTNVSLYIVGIVSILLVLGILVYTFIPDQNKEVKSVELWQLVLPVLTTLIGFLFGSSIKHNSEK